MEKIVRTIFGKVDRLNMTDEQVILFAFQGKTIYVVATSYSELLTTRDRVQHCLETIAGNDLGVMVEGQKLYSIRFRSGGEIIFAKGDERGDDEWARGMTFYGGTGRVPKWIHIEP